MLFSAERPEVVVKQFRACKLILEMDDLQAIPSTPKIRIFDTVLILT
jgi:hypothetical protein